MAETYNTGDFVAVKGLPLYYGGQVVIAQKIGIVTKVVSPDTVEVALLTSQNILPTDTRYRYCVSCVPSLEEPMTSANGLPKLVLESLEQPSKLQLTRRVYVDHKRYVVFPPPGMVLGQGDLAKCYVIPGNQFSTGLANNN